MNKILGRKMDRRRIVLSVPKDVYKNLPAYFYTDLELINVEQREKLK